MMQVFVKCPTGKTVAVEVESTASILQLKSQLSADYAGTPKDVHAPSLYL